MIKAEIRAERHVQLAYDRAHAHHNRDPSSDENTLDDLLRIKNDALRWHATCKALLGELREVRYKSRSSGEQLRAEVASWERSLDRAARICADLVRLGIEDRIARVTQAQTEQMAAMLSQLIASILARGGLDYGTDTRPPLGHRCYGRTPRRQRHSLTGARQNTHAHRASPLHVLTQRTRSPWTAHARVVAGPREVIHLV